jgi:hypothetical protein
MKSIFSILVLSSLIGCGGSGANVTGLKTVTVTGTIYHSTMGSPPYPGMIVEVWPLKDGKQPPGYDAEAQASISHLDGSYTVNNVPTGYTFVVQVSDPARRWLATSPQFTPKVDTAVNVPVN